MYASRWPRGDQTAIEMMYGEVTIWISRPSLRQIAKVSGGKAFTAEDSDSLKSIYKTLGSQLGTKEQKKQITASFAIGGLVLLLGAAVSSLRWAGRLP